MTRRSRRCRQGKAIVDFGGTDVANGVAVQPDGKIVVNGTTSAVGSGDFAVARLTTEGSLDPTFSGDGKLTAGYGAANEEGLAVAVQQNGRIVLFGQGDVNSDFVVSPLGTRTAAADTSFGSGDTVGVDFGGSEFDGDVALQPDGQIVLVGSTNASIDESDIAVARLQGDPVQTTTAPGRGRPTRRAARGRGRAHRCRGRAPPRIFKTSPSSRSRVALSFERRDSRPPRWGGASSTTTGSSPGPRHRGHRLRPGLDHIDPAQGDRHLPHPTDRDRQLGPKATTERFVPIHRLKIKPPRRRRGLRLREPGAGQPGEPRRLRQVVRLRAARRQQPWGGERLLRSHLRRSTGEVAATSQGRSPARWRSTASTCPCPRGVKTIYDSTGKVSVDGLSQLSVRVGPFLTKTIDLNFKVTPEQAGRVPPDQRRPGRRTRPSSSARCRSAAPSRST